MKHLAIVGCGRVAERYYLPALRDSSDWRLIAAVDPDPVRRAWIARLLPGVTVHPTLAGVPEGVAIDAVLVASPPPSHGSVAVEALRRGAHVFLEKPMTPTAAEARALVQLAQDRGRQLRIGFNRRFRSSYGYLRDRLRQLPQERIVSICYDLRSDISRWDPISAYLGREEQGGGVLDDIASHQLDLVPWVLALPVLAVSASRPACTAEAVNIRLRFPGGIEAQCHARHGGPAAERFEVVLDRGVLLATRGGLTDTRRVPLGLARRVATARDASLGVIHRLTRQPNVTVLSVRRQLADWAEAIRSGHSAIAADGAAGARCVGLVEICRESLARGGAWLEPLE